MVKRRVFYLIDAMGIGGTSKNLLNILSAYDYSAVDVFVGLLQHKGKFLPLIPKQVHLIDLHTEIPLIPPPSLVCIKAAVRKMQWRDVAVLSYLYLRCKSSGSSLPYHRFLQRNIPVMEMEFDEAFAYVAEHSFDMCYVADKVRAKKKYAWIHVDVSKFHVDRNLMKSVLLLYDKIFLVSNEGKAVFDALFPTLCGKSEYRRNVVIKEQIEQFSLTGPTYDDDFKGTRILTIGRISPEKGQEDAIKALASVVGSGHDVRWYFVGGGSEEFLDKCKQLACSLGIAERAVFMGSYVNPYRFLKDCDLYVQPSRHEGFCISLAEAICIGKPIVSTGFTGAREQLQDKSDAIITGMKPSDIAKGIETMIGNNLKTQG